METSPFKPHLVVIGLLLLASLALAFTVDVHVTDEAGIKIALPDRVGDWRGEEIRYCQDPACQREIGCSALADPTVCPVCGGALDPMSMAEKNLLPADTIVLKKRYGDPVGQIVFVSIVLSGKERASIHRPQVCLVGQGSEIVRSEVLPVPIQGRPALDVMVLDLLRRVRTPDDRTLEYTSYYAYWFVGKGRETPYHVQRMIWMATDRIFHNVSHRWAYIAVSGARLPASEEYKDQIRAFVRDLYPQMVRESG